MPRYGDDPESNRQQAGNDLGAKAETHGPSGAHLSCGQSRQEYQVDQHDQNNQRDKVHGRGVYSARHPDQQTRAIIECRNAMTGARAEAEAGDQGSPSII